MFFRFCEVSYESFCGFLRNYSCADSRMYRADGAVREDSGEGRERRSADCGKSEIAGQFGVDNPMDAYFLPKLNGATGCIEFRDLQDAYFTAWLAEYTNLIEYIHALCTHEQDIAAIDAYDSALREQLKSARILFFTDWRSCTMRSRLRAMTPAGTERAVG